MARIDDYISAKKIAAQKLSKASLREIADRSGFKTIDPQTLRAPFLDRIYCISYPDFTFSDETGPEKEAPLQEQVLMLHYLLAPNPSAGPENWIAYREIPGAYFYFAAFGKRAIDPLKKAFGQNISGLAASAGRLGGRSIRTGDAGFTFHVFPHVPVQLILWQGDDEFAPEANILFDKSIGEILLPEDIAWLSGMLVYRLISS